MILQANVENLRAELNAIIDMRIPELEATLAELIEDTMLAALFTTTTALPPSPLSVPRGTIQEGVMRHEIGRMSVMIWRMLGELHCLIRRPDKLGLLS